MNIPKPPWYGPLERKLEGVEWLADALLIVIIVASVYLLFKGDRAMKVLFTAYMISP